jgi:hypothetical protein
MMKTTDADTQHRSRSSEQPQASFDPDAAPLSEREHRLIDRALHRLHEAMREFWSAWHIERRNATQLARELKVDRTTCQRLASLAREGYRAAAMIETMPGPKALRILIDAAADVDAPPSQRVLKSFRAAVDGFEEQLRNTTGSVSQLKRRFAAATTATAPSDASDRLDPQEALFHAARRITGRHVHTISSIGIYDTVGVAHDQLRHLRASVNHGIVARPDAVPMVLEAFDGTSTAPADGWQRTLAILPDYTNAAWTTVELQSSAGFASSAIEITKSEEPSDVCGYTAFPVPHPRTLDNPIEESWFILYSPAAMLVFDLYLHESIARQCLLALDVHLWQTSFANAPHGKWHTRLPQQPTIMQLGRGLNRAATEHYPAQRELTLELFNRANADPDEYIGYRCAEPYPMWRTGYRYELDFGSGA